jgi:hypothetical protein
MQLVRHQRVEVNVSLPPPALPITVDVILSRAHASFLGDAARSQGTINTCWSGQHDAVRDSSCVCTVAGPDRLTIGLVGGMPIHFPFPVCWHVALAFSRALTRDEE